MNDPIKLLENEHKVIKEVLNILSQIISNEFSNSFLDDLDKIIDFIKVFADKCHHGKEEGILFNILMSKGIPVEGGPIGVMLMEHEIGREYVKNMSSILAQVRGGDEVLWNDFKTYAKRYIDLLREHIYKEDNILFQIAREVLNQTELEDIAEKFEEYEIDEVGRNVHNKYIKLIESLSRKYITQDIKDI